MISALIVMPRMRGRAVLSALPYVLDDNTRREAAVVYLTDALMAVSRNTAIHEDSRIMSRRFADIIEPRREVEDNRTSEDVIAHMKAKLQEVSEDRPV